MTGRVSRAVRSRFAAARRGAAMSQERINSPRAARRAAVARPLETAVFQPLSAGIGLEVAGVSVCGRKQAHNTDHYAALRLGRMQEMLTTSLSAADIPPLFEEYA